MENKPHLSNPPIGGFEAVRLKWATMAGSNRGEAMRKSNSRISILLIAILLGSLITWTPTVSASGNSSPVEQLQAQGISALFDSETE